jgi:hypothetical protein
MLGYLPDVLETGDPELATTTLVAPLIQALDHRTLPAVTFTGAPSNNMAEFPFSKSSIAVTTLAGNTVTLPADVPSPTL